MSVVVRPYWLPRPGTQRLIRLNESVTLSAESLRAAPSNTSRRLTDPTRAAAKWS